MPEPDAVIDTGSTPKRDRGGVWPRVRWMIGASSATIGAALAIASYWITPLRICRESECNPWSMVELIPFLVISLLAALPDLSEVTIGSIVSLKRRIDHQQGDLDRTIRRQEAVEQQVLQLTNISTSQHVTQQFYLPTGSAADLPDAISKKRDLIAQVDDNDDTPVISERDRSLWMFGGPYISDYRPDDARRALQLLEQWEGLDRFINLRYPFDSRSQSGAEHLLGQARSNFAALFTEEIDMVRSVRNSIAHARFIPTEDLQGALRAAEELNRILAAAKLSDLAEL